MVPPHPPYVFNESCKTGGSGSDDFQASNWENRHAYIRSYRCVVDILGPALDRIIARDPSATIIVSGDHGPGFLGGGNRNGAALTKDALDERASVFLAIRGPARRKSGFRSIQRLDRLYPVLFACLQ